MYQLAIIGPNQSACTPELYHLAYQLGAALAHRSIAVINGGMGGVMEAVFKGIQDHCQVSTGPTIGILPFQEHHRANPYCTVVLPTGLGVARNALIVQAAHLVVALGGGAGTLSELALAWQYQKTVLCYTGLGGWSERLAGIDLDARHKGLLVPVPNLSTILQYIDHAQQHLDVTSGTA